MSFPMQDFQAICQKMLLQIQASFTWNPVSYMERGKNIKKAKIKKAVRELKGKLVIFFLK